MRVLVCGSRTWAYDGPSAYDLDEPLCDARTNDARILVATLEGLLAEHLYVGGDEFVVIEGGATGADSVAWRWADDGGVDREHYPADWDTHGRAAGHVRNARMLTEGKPSLVLAFTHSLATSKGTANMVDRARAARLPTYVIGRSL